MSRWTDEGEKEREVVLSMTAGGPLETKMASHQLCLELGPSITTTSIETTAITPPLLQPLFAPRLPVPDPSPGVRVEVRGGQGMVCGGTGLCLSQVIEARWAELPLDRRHHNYNTTTMNGITTIITPPTHQHHNKPLTITDASSSLAKVVSSK